MNIENHIIKGERVLLRNMREDDAPYIIRWRNNPDIIKWMFNQNPLTLEEHIRWFYSEEKQKRYDYIICDILNDKPIGSVCFNNIEGHKAELGKMIGDKNYEGKGYAKEAVSLWLDFGFNILRLTTIIAKTMSNNTANIKLNEKLGFVIEKEDIVVYDNNPYKIFVMTLRKHS